MGDRFQALGEDLCMTTRNGLPSVTGFAFATEEECQEAANLLNDGTPVTFVHLIETGDFYITTCIYPQELRGRRLPAFSGGVEYMQTPESGCYAPFTRT